MAAAAGRRVETAERSGGKGTVGVVETGGCLEDSGLILGAEAPFGVWLWVHNPGNTGVGWGLQVRIGWFQLPSKETGLGLKASHCTRA